MDWGWHVSAFFVRHILHAVSEFIRREIVDIDDVEHGALPKAPPFLRPLIMGTAVKGHG